MPTKINKQQRKSTKNDEKTFEMNRKNEKIDPQISKNIRIIVP